MTSTTDDKKLLQDAANAINYLLEDDDDEGLSWTIWGENNCPIEWNPLTDDGDALRLAVELKLVIDCCSACAMPTQQDIGWSDGGIPKDPYAATRRAIVRAAAAVGEKL